MVILSFRNSELPMLEYPDCFRIAGQKVHHFVEGCSARNINTHYDKLTLRRRRASALASDLDTGPSASLSQ